MQPPESTNGRAPSADVRLRWKLFGFAAAALTAGAVAVGSPAAAAPADGTIRDSGTAEVVANSYIVVLKSGAASVSSRSQSLAGRYGAAVKHTYDSALTGFSATMSEARAKRLAADPAVDYVQRDGIHSLAGTQTNPPWGLDRIDQRDLPLNASYTYPDVTRTVTVYVLDTGVRFSHQQFATGRATSGPDFVSNDNDSSDCHGHGTHVAGTIAGSTYGVAKSARIVGLRVLNCSGNGSTSGIVAAINWVTSQKNANPAMPAVANMSLGGGADSALDTAVANSVASGVQYSLAAGNGDIFGNPQNACTTSPARTPSAVTVGATQSNDARASFSNFGTCLDLFAPGVGVLSSWYTSDTATNTISGTSMAAPHVAGAMALVLAANPTFTAQQVRDALVNNATPNKVTNPLTGSPNLLLFVGTGGTPPPPPPPPPGCSGTNGTDVNIPDNNSNVFSNIAIGGCNRNASNATTVEVHIVHTWRGDLVVDLIAPDGTAYSLSNRSGGSADNIDATYTVNASSEAANGTWRLRVRDAARLDVGFINSWTLTV